MFIQLISLINDYITFFLVIPSIFIIGIYLTSRVGFIQITKLKKGISHLLKTEKGETGNISHFEAISTVLAGNLGTGNISGMAVAMSTGGPGALVWMWVMAFLGAILKYAGCVLGVKYRHINEEGEYVGGPMYYIDQGLGLKSVACLFSLFTILTAFTVGNFVQVNSVTLPLSMIGWNPLVCGVVIAVLVAIVLLGGMSRVSVVAATVVPIMALIYFLAALFIIFMHLDQLLPSLKLMIQSAFGFQSLAGGALGYGVLKAISVGFERGVFATDAGVGVAPILQSSAKTKNPVVEGIVAMVAPIVVMVICTLTGLVLIITGAWLQPDLESTNMCTWAFEQGIGHWFGAHLVIISLVLFAFTTILAWAYCAEKAAEYLWGLRSVKWLMILYVLLIPVGTMIDVSLAWKLADTCMAVMLFANLLGVTGLSNVVITESNAYLSKDD
jgi:alanine or glycine:cation symporter, AGCS family